MSYGVVVGYFYDQLYIDGHWQAPTLSEEISVVSAASEECVGRVPLGGTADVDRAVAAARRAFDDPHGWARWSPNDRAEVLRRFADELDSRKSEMVRRVSLQNGMPVSIGAQTEGAYPALLLRFYADLITGQAAEETRRSLVAGSTVVRKEPIGVVAAIVPWNFPQSLTFFKLAPALAAGATIVLKPASETVLDAFFMAEAAEAAGLPAGVLNVVTGDGHDVGSHLVTHPAVDKVAFTGSTGAGRTIAEQCGRLLRPVTLELGGKSAGIILDDVDVPTIAKQLFGATLLNQGQTCFISTRILAPQSRYDEIVDMVTALAKSLPIGDPLDRSTLIGPLASAKQRATVERYIRVGQAEGGRITTGGGRPAHLDRGWYIEPTIFADVDNRSTIAQDEPPRV
ncbi:aldehyde dehydrogenase family protein [Mycolicibacterium phocaicum]|nr:aldehyde dehydrogenase family protein [Mycolicibacterium phocaicum]